MIILKKSRILIIMCLVITSIVSYNITTNTTENIVQTVSLPVSNKVIVIDAGHGVPDEGAESSSGTTEAETNLKIALKMQNLLET